MTRRRQDVAGSGALNLTSLVDIALSLVIGFIVSVPLFFETGIFVSAPGVARAGADDPATDVKANVYLDDDGTIVLNEATVTERQLVELLPKLLERSVERKVIVSAGEFVKYDRVIRVLDVAKQSGAADLALLRRRRAQ